MISLVFLSDCSYSFTDFFSFYGDVEVITRDKENILKTPNTFNIDTPVGYVFNYTEGNLYEWTA